MYVLGDLALGIRALRRTPGVVTMAVAALALGIAAGVMLFVGLIASYVPARRAARLNLSAILRREE